jgi:hypothetical protein
MGASATALLVLAVAAPPAARAYRDLATFGAPVLAGGAAGRAFTGAPGDGYACGVCHRGGRAPHLDVAGLPAAGWEPGATYEIAVTFPADARTVGAALELATPDGRAAGAFVLPAEAALEAADRCRDGSTATARESAGGRIVARTQGCGARRVRVRWTAPDVTSPGVRLFVAAVAADDSGTPEGDGATALALPLPQRGVPPVEGPSVTQRGCAASGAGRWTGHGRDGGGWVGRAAAPWCVPACAALAAAFARRARRARRSGRPGRTPGRARQRW